MFLKSIKRRELIQSDALSAYSDIEQRLLKGRGISSPEEVSYRLQELHGAESLLNIEAAVGALIEMIDHQQKVVIVGDFDADGATSTALLMLALKEFGIENLRYQIPNRFEYGYGLSAELVNSICEYEKPDWVITVDNGVSSVAGVARAKDLGIKTLITDHHLPPEHLPDAEVIVNPNQDHDGFPSKHLAGVGVAFYLLIALRQALRQQGRFDQQAEPNLANWIDLVALGTVADLVKLDKNNRIMVAQGLQRIRAGLCRPGILALLEAAKRDHRFIEASDLGFAVGPRLNAAGRLDDMSLGIECLIADDFSKARGMAMELDELNRSRRDIQQSMEAEAEAHLKAINLRPSERPNALCLFDPTWHQGVVGLVASKIKEKLNRPVIVFAPDDELRLKGSGRSVEGLHLRDILANIDAANPGLLQKFGGHAMAAGMTLATADFEHFSAKFSEEVERALADSSISEDILTDGEWDFSSISVEAVESVFRLGPFGQGFAEPLFDGRFTVISKQILAEKHLKLVLQPSGCSEQLGIDAILFFASIDLLHSDLHQVELVYSLNINRFRGNESVQLLIQQLRSI